MYHSANSSKDDVDDKVTVVQTLNELSNAVKGDNAEIVKLVLLKSNFLPLRKYVYILSSRHFSAHPQGVL
ncbi:hypothetical protein ACEPAF_7963 [Sanghuangporus sanghuang]